MSETSKNKSDLKQKLLKSSAIASLNQELSIYEKFSDKGWAVSHSPYYLDNTTGKFREVDIAARKYYRPKNNEFSFGVNFIVECKSINNYHIVVCNEEASDGGNDLEDDWIGNDGLDNYPKTIKYLKENKIEEKDIEETLIKFNNHLFPNGTIHHIKYKLRSFEIPTYCSFRETNIGQTKELENSVVWKAFQGLYSFIQARQHSKWQSIEYWIKTIENKSSYATYDERLNNLLESLKDTSNHIEITHPILVVESKLWELKDEDLKELKFCRLSYEEIDGMSKWIDIVTYENLDEYLENINIYDEFYSKDE